MTALEIYKAQFEEERTWWPVQPISKYEWVAHRVFDLTTYDRSLDKLFIDTLIEVSKVILEERTYEYICHYRWLYFISDS